VPQPHISHTIVYSTTWGYYRQSWPMTPSRGSGERPGPSAGHQLATICAATGIGSNADGPGIVSYDTVGRPDQSRSRLEDSSRRRRRSEAACAETETIDAPSDRQGWERTRSQTDRADARRATVSRTIRYMGDSVRRRGNSSCKSPGSSPSAGSCTRPRPRNSYNSHARLCMPDDDPAGVPHRPRARRRPRRRSDRRRRRRGRWQGPCGGTGTGVVRTYVISNGGARPGAPWTPGPRRAGPAPRNERGAGKLCHSDSVPLVLPNRSASACID
jgi:hypothetical protein